MIITVEFLNAICSKVAQKLRNLPNELTCKNDNLDWGTQLIFPKVQDNKPRISEQEARFIFSQEIEKWGQEIYYSVETPTIKKYKFSGTGETTASSDISLFELCNGEFIRKLNIELKAHNKDQRQFDHDFEKLLKEPYNGLFFQVLESVNNGTLTIDGKRRKGVLVKYRRAVLNSQNIWDVNTRNNTWFMHIVIYSHKPNFLLSKTFTKYSFEEINSFFNLKYGISRHQQDITVSDSNNWTLVKGT